MKKALSVRDIITKKYQLFNLSPEWAAAFGRPAKRGVWFVWGDSGNGKTSFVMQLCRELANHGVVAYNSLEEGAEDTMKNTLLRHDMENVSRRFQVLCEPIEEMEERMDRRKSPDFYVVDSLQYTQMTYKEYRYFKEAHRDKLIIFISHADGKKPDGRVAKRVMSDASLKIYVEGFRAFSKGRYFGTEPHYTIWAEGAARYWGSKETKNNINTNNQNIDDHEQENDNN